MLLAMDTATQTASLAIYDLDTDQLLAEWTWQSRRRQTQDLLVAAQNMLSQINLTASQLTALAVTTGPGSFTGVRIAVSAAKGISIGLPTLPRVVGIPTLAVTAMPWLPLLHSTMFESGQQGPVVCAYLQAGRGRYNWAFFHKNTHLWLPTADDHWTGKTDEFATALINLAPQQIYLVGESTPDLRTAIDSLTYVCYLDDVSSMRRAGQLARCASRHLAAAPSDSDASNSSASDRAAALQPLYLQAP